MRNRVLICGCGYVGLAAGARLAAQGHTVFGIRRSAESNDSLLAAGIAPLQGDLSRLSDVAALPGPFDWIINVVSSAHGGETAYRSAYLESTRNLVRTFAGSRCRYVYTSSTSVYAHTEGEWINEDSAACPPTITGQILRQTESELLAAASPTFRPTVLRVAGIYGPGRHHLLNRLRSGHQAGGDPARWLNMVHRDDVAAAILTALGSDCAGETFNIVDDEPVRLGQFQEWLAGRLGLRAEELATDANGPSARAPGSKRVSNLLVRERLGWRPQFPSFREGYATILATPSGTCPR